MVVYSKFCTTLLNSGAAILYVCTYVSMYLLYYGTKEKYISVKILVSPFISVCLLVCVTHCYCKGYVCTYVCSYVHTYVIHMQVCNAINEAWDVYSIRVKEHLDSGGHLMNFWYVCAYMHVHVG